MSLIQVENLTLHGGERVLVRELNLTVHAGERWVVLGPNGAGKSTLLATLAGVRTASKGAVRLQGRSVQQMAVGELAQRRALMTDRWVDPFTASVLDTVCTARYRFHTEHSDAADPQFDPEGKAQAQHWLSALEVADLSERDVRSLSRGERQRVALATALAQDTPLLLLDEPTAHQDPRHQAVVLNTLRGLETTPHACIVSLHDMNAAVGFATHALLLTGHGPWHGGPAQEVLTASCLSAVFAVRIRALSTPEATLFITSP